jgi:hypothetical protein
MEHHAAGLAAVERGVDRAPEASGPVNVAVDDLAGTALSARARQLRVRSHLHRAAADVGQSRLEPQAPGGAGTSDMDVAGPQRRHVRQQQLRLAGSERRGGDADGWELGSAGAAGPLEPRLSASAAAAIAAPKVKKLERADTGAPSLMRTVRDGQFAAQ